MFFVKYSFNSISYVTLISVKSLRYCVAICWHCVAISGIFWVTSWLATLIFYSIAPIFIPLVEGGSLSESISNIRVYSYIIEDLLLSIVGYPLANFDPNDVIESVLVNRTFHEAVNFISVPEFVPLPEAVDFYLWQYDWSQAAILLDFQIITQGLAVFSGAVLVFGVKFCLIIILLIFIRGGIPRYRYDFLTKMGWFKYFSWVLLFFTLTFILYALFS